jgi:hypothetical protein
MGSAALWREAIPTRKRACFVANVVTEEWHFRMTPAVDGAMVAARIAEFPESPALIERYATHWLEACPARSAGRTT